MERVLEQCGIALNKNTVPGDKSAMMPGGIRMGTPAITSRGFETSDMPAVAELIHDGIQLACTLKARSRKLPATRVEPCTYSRVTDAGSAVDANPKAKLKDFIATMGSEQAQVR